VIDASGVDVVLPRPPRRIVSLVPSTTETLCALGLADALVGITAYCVEPAAVVRGKRRIGGEKDPDLDAIRALAPDLVVANIEENLRAHVEALRGWGIPVWVTYPRTVAAGIAMIRELGEVTATAARAAALAGALEPWYARVREATGARPPVPVFYAIWRAPYMTVGRDTYIADMLRVCGAVSIFEDAGARYPATTLDEVAARRPAVILLPDEPFRFRRAHLADFAPYPEVPAVRDGRVHLVEGKAFSWHGPRIGEALATLPALFHPDLFGAGAATRTGSSSGRGGSGPGTAPPPRGTGPGAPRR
jgi:ABC-type Fe3+-hydroxamate transport system substrate-binding protein